MAEKYFDGYWCAGQAGLESPIELSLYTKLKALYPSIEVEKQKQVGPYRADMFIAPRYVIEADGEDFHDRVSDYSRDTWMLEHGFVTIRCSGKLIHYSARKVAVRIKEIVDWYERLPDPTQRLRAWHIYSFDQLPKVGER